MARLLITLGCTGDHPETMPSREDMGALLGITTETASRIMAEFKRRGLVHVRTRAGAGRKRQGRCCKQCRS
jgi:DNA-binding transcriptional regulator YhcF (GntR family)